jgi:hypothetical protein|tara:strand:- start:3572 stop:4033 length:462 start_codon:yes stop_codon:yes gene_type:complete
MGMIRRILFFLIIGVMHVQAVNIAQTSVYSDSNSERMGVKVPLGIDKLAIIANMPYTTASTRMLNHNLGIDGFPIPFLGDTAISGYYQETDTYQENGFVIEKHALYRVARNIYIGVNISIMRQALRRESGRHVSSFSLLDSFSPMIQVKLFGF